MAKLGSGARGGSRLPRGSSKGRQSSSPSRSTTPSPTPTEEALGQSLPVGVRDQPVADVLLRIPGRSDIRDVVFTRRGGSSRGGSSSSVSGPQTTVAQNEAVKKVQDNALSKEIRRVSNLRSKLLSQGAQRVIRNLRQSGTGQKIKHETIINRRTGERIFTTTNLATGEKTIRTFQRSSGAGSIQETGGYTQGRTPKYEDNKSKRGVTFEEVQELNKSKRTINQLFLDTELDKLRRLRGKLATKSQRTRQQDLLNELALLGVTIAETGLSGSVGIITLPITLVSLARNPSNLTNIPSIISEGGERFGQILRTSPTEALGLISGEVLLFKGSGKIMKAVGKVTKPIAVRLLPSFKGVKRTAIGIKTIKNVSGGDAKEIFVRSGKPVYLRSRVERISIKKPSTLLDKIKGKKPGQFKKFTKKNIDIEIIPGRKSKPEIDIPKVIRETPIEKQLKKIPKLPTNIPLSHRRLLRIIKRRGDTISGSFAQQTLLKRKFTRPYKDLDILTKDRVSLIKEIKNEFGRSVTFRRLKVSIEVKYRGKPIADLVEFAKGEGGYASKFKSIKVNGINLVDPRARLGGKLTQIKFSKITPKGLRDISQLSGGKLNLDTPSITGAFGKTSKQLRSSIGKRGPVITAQEDLFKSVNRNKIKNFISSKGKVNLKNIRDLLSKDNKGLKLKKWLYATPSDPRTGKGLVRVSRLGLDQREASLLDLMLGEEISFFKNKPQIFVFPDEKIFPKVGKLTKSKIRPTEGFVVPEFSSELEVVLGSGWTIKKGKLLAKTLIDNRVVPIYEMKKIRLSKVSKELYKSLLEERKNLNKILNKKLPSDVKNRDLLRNKIKKLLDKEDKFNRKIRNEMGIKFRVNSLAKKGRRIIPVKSLLTRSLSKLPKVRTRVGSFIRSPTKRSNSRKAITSRNYPTKKSPPKRSIPKKPLVNINIPKGFSKKKLKRSEPVYYIDVKRRGKIVSLTPRPLTLRDAKDYLAYNLDKNLARSGWFEPLGTAQNVVELPKIMKGYFSMNSRKLRPFRIRLGKRKAIRNGYIEKTKYIQDTLNEKRQLALARKRVKKIKGRVIKKKRKR